jgi:peptidoglycan/LPS O-acetylase OafA/YrhL
VAEVGGSYRPHLDGLRAVAVYLVVAFHAGWDRFSGGFVGVDVFFVLSGFLVTRLLVADVVRVGGVRFGRFYARRFRRLLPAAVVTLLVAGVVFSAVASPVAVEEASGGFRAAFLYVTNWFFIDQSADYFGADLESNPVLHFWSLAVEEQFYLVWPLLLGGLVWLGRRLGGGWRVVQVGVVVVAVASVVWAWSLRDSDPVRAYYGTDARAYQLMAGAALALAPGAVARLGRAGRWVALGAMGALVVVSTSLVEVDPIERGVLVTVLVVGILAGMEAGSGGVLQRVLSLPPVVYLGKISYGTYLWHWPVILIGGLVLELSTVSTLAIAVLLATALASLSFQLMEHPIRISGLLDRHRLPVIAGGLTTSVICALVLVPTLLDPTTTNTPTADTTTGFTPVPPIDFDALAEDYPELVSCADQPVEACTVVEGTGPHVLLIGDSHAGMMIPVLTELARANDFTLSIDVRGGCPWQRDLYRIPRSTNGLPQPIAGCKGHKDDVYDRVVPELDPDLVVAMNLDFPAQGLPFVDEQENELDLESREFDELTERSIDVLEQGGRAVVVFEPIPPVPIGYNPVECLGVAEVVQECRFTAPEDGSPIEDLYRRLDAEDDQLWSVDIDGLVCPFLPICDPIVNGEVVRIYGHHLTAQFATSIEPAIEAHLDSMGVLATLRT